jgi:hypothetical protein
VERCRDDRNADLQRRHGYEVHAPESNSHRDCAGQRTRRVHKNRESWAGPDGTTFYFIDDGPERALELARKSAARIMTLHIAHPEQEGDDAIR